MKKNLALTLTFVLLAAFTIAPALCEANERRDSVLELNYNPIEMDLPLCPVTIAVVKFTEPKLIKYVGTTTTFKFKPSPDVGTWMAKSLMKQLKSEGYNVEYFESIDDAGDRFIITGIANKTYFDRPGELDMRYKVQLDGMVVKDNKLLFAMNYTSKQNKEMLYTGSNSGKLMAGLHDIFGIFLPEAIKAINENR